MIARILCVIAVYSILPTYSTPAKDMLAELSNAGRKIMEQSAIPGATIRQCSCQEQTTCINEIRSQASQCFDSCWDRLKTITNNPTGLRQCVSDQNPLISQFLSCVDKQLHSCWPDRNGPQIQKQDLAKFIRLSEEKLESSKNALLNNPSIKPIQKLLGAAINFGYCVKDCFVGKNAGGFCFDRLKCQPLINEDRARKSLKKCLKTVDWKSRASEFCECSLKAGVT
ncbi:unnamed protein product [Enterobius vermicularis]|uniref:DUF19 domain-containing protein n=1 Tax=Enterobius vermicularis TaxID=51028 RepID=A0A0N4UV92_ENTVE|nr:unnamed protein product [Enterobius vermicularis]